VTNAGIFATTGNHRSAGLVVVVLFLALSLAATSFVHKIKSVNASVTDDTYLNSQTIALLEAALNPTAPSLALGGGDIVIVGDALLAETGPSGTLADVDTTSSSGHISIYVVREGDTLSQIAYMFGVSTNTIRWANDISRDTAIRPGQSLTILPITGLKYVVEKGDTLEGVAEDHGGDAEEILAYNGITVDEGLSVGQEIIIPNGEVVLPESSSPTYTSAPRVTSSSPTYSGYYMRPVAGGTRSQGVHGYNGVDLATYNGAEIFAAAGGDVIISKNGGWNGGYGNYVVIRHENGTQTLYAHNSYNIVDVGQRVVQGQVIGYVGNTGRSTGSHVHFEVRGATNPF